VGTGMAVIRWSWRNTHVGWVSSGGSLAIMAIDRPADPTLVRSRSGMGRPSMMVFGVVVYSHA